MIKLPKHPFYLNPWILAVSITFIVLWVLMQFALKPKIEAVASQVIGARVTIGSCYLNIFTQKASLTNFKIYNQEGFPAEVFFNSSKMLVNVDLWEALHGKLHFPLIIFSLDKIIVFRNTKGKLNVYELKIVQEKLKDKKKEPLPNFKIDTLKLSIDEVIVHDDTKTPAVITAYNLNLKDKTIKNIDGVPKLVGLVLMESLKPTAIRSAEMFAATTLLGVAFLPGLALGVAVSSDDASFEFTRSSVEMHTRVLELVKHLKGQIKKEESGKIYAKVYGCDVVIQVQDLGWRRSKVIIKARKYLLAKQEIAAGLLYQLKEDLK